MATQSGGKSGSSGRSSRASGKRRATSKPVIIDLEADAVSQPAPSPASTSAPSSASASAKAAKTADNAREDTASGLSDAEAQTAGLSADAKVKPAPSSAAKTSIDPADDPVGSVVPPSTAAAASSGGPSPFYLFAAGLIGALLAMVLMFLASLAGLFSLSDGRIDDQVSALVALEQRVEAVEAQPSPVEAAAFDPAVLDPLQNDVANLRAQLDDLVPASGDAASMDVPALVADQVDPLSARLTSVEGALQSALAALEGAEPGAIVAPDPALAARMDELAAAVGALSADRDALEAQMQAFNTAIEGLAEVSANAQPVSIAPETDARLDALDGLAADTAAQLLALSGGVAALESTVSGLGSQVDGVDAAMGAVVALVEAPVAQAPDRLARLDVALGAIEGARDGGQTIAPAMDAALAAASFDGPLSDALAPAASLNLDTPLSSASILAAYDAVYGAMRAAAPAQEGSGLLGALEERARQMVTIRAPEGAVLGAEAGPLDQLDTLGGLIAAARFGEALSLANDLPAPMQQASGGLIETLNTRAALDGALHATRQALLAALAAPTINSQ